MSCFDMLQIFCICYRFPCVVFVVGEHTFVYVSNNEVFLRNIPVLSVYCLIYNINLSHLRLYLNEST